MSAVERRRRQLCFLQPTGKIARSEGETTTNSELEAKLMPYLTVPISALTPGHAPPPSSQRCENNTFRALDKDDTMKYLSLESRRYRCASIPAKPILGPPLKRMVTTAFIINKFCDDTDYCIALFSSLSTPKLNCLRARLSLS